MTACPHEKDASCSACMACELFKRLIYAIAEPIGQDAAFDAALWAIAEVALEQREGRVVAKALQNAAASITRMSLH